MRNITKKTFAVMLVLLVVMTCVFAQSIVEVKHGEMYGKTVVLHTNDVHGALEGYAKVAALRDQYLALDADVILVENGDYSQGSPYVSRSKGATAITMMNTVGYDIVGLGNHEFDYGYEQLAENTATRSSTRMSCTSRQWVPRSLSSVSIPPKHRRRSTRL